MGLHGWPQVASNKGFIYLRYKGKEIPLLFDGSRDIEEGLGYILKMFGENLFYNDGSEHDAGDVFYANAAGGGVGRRRRRFTFVPVENIPSLSAINPSKVSSGTLDGDLSVPVLEMIEIAPA